MEAHQGFAGTDIRSITRDHREVLEVRDGLIFPIIASLSAFARKTDEAWRIKPPEMFKDEEPIRDANSVYQSVASSSTL